MSITPTALLVGAIQGQYERRFTEKSTVGVALSYWGWGDYQYLSMDGKYRIYPPG